MVCRLRSEIRPHEHGGRLLLTVHGRQHKIESSRVCRHVERGSGTSFLFSHRLHHCYELPVDRGVN